MPRLLWWFYGGGRFLMSEAPLYRHTAIHYKGTVVGFDKKPVRISVGSPMSLRMAYRRVLCIILCLCPYEWPTVCPYGWPTVGPYVLSYVYVPTSGLPYVPTDGLTYVPTNGLT